MPDVTRELELMASSLDFPETPDLAGAVARELAARPAPPRRLRIVRRPLVLAALILLLAAATVFAAVPGVRHTVLQFLHLRGATVERRSSLPDVKPHHPALGSRLTLAQARGVVPFRILVPARYGAPDAAYVREGGVSLVYRGRSRLLLSEFRGSEDPSYVQKITGPRTSVRRLTIAGERAIWVSGAPHFFFYRTPDGRQRFETLRLAGNVLLLERGELLIRVEGTFGLREAKAIALSLR